MNYVLVADAEVVATWPADDLDGVRPAQRGDAEAIRQLHDAEFPRAYLSANQILERADAGDQVVYVAEVAGASVGYAAGRVHGGGEGCVDFLGVHPEARGRGFGRRLVMALVRELLRRSTTETVTLSVDEGLAPARAVYAALSFRTAASFVSYGYRRTG